MTSRALGLDLHDADGNGVYPMAPDDAATLADDAARAGLRTVRMDLAGCHDAATSRQAVAAAMAAPRRPADHWDALSDALRDPASLPGTKGCVLLFDHTESLWRADRDAFAQLRRVLAAAATAWQERKVPFFAFMAFPDNETRDAAIDA